MIKIKQLWNWMLSAWPILIPIFIGFIPIIFQFEVSEAYFQYFGATIEVVGLLFLIVGVNDKLSHFGKPTIFKAIKNWFRAFPLRRGKIVSGFGGSASGAGIASARGFGHHNLEGLSIDEKIKHLNDEVYKLKIKHSEIEVRIDNEVKKIQDRIKVLDESFDSRIKIQEKRMESLLAGNYKFELFGALLLIIGVVYNGVPELMAEMYR